MGKPTIDPNLFGIIGIGRFGATLAQELLALGKDVIALDNSPEKLEKLKQKQAESITSTRSPRTRLPKPALTVRDRHRLHRQRRRKQYPRHAERKGTRRAPSHQQGKQRRPCQGVAETGSGSGIPGRGHGKKTC